MKRLLVALTMFWVVPALAEEAPKPDYTKAAGICQLIDAAAEKHGLPKSFFARLIWKESRFDIKAVSPVGAQGVAQFMPATAKRRGLADPFDPEQAIPASASLLADLKAAYGNFGLAAAAYNAGSGRVDKWRAGRSGLPGETRGYVYDITGRPAEWFREKGREVEAKPLTKGETFAKSCPEMKVIATRASPRPRWGVIVAGGRSRRAALIAFERARRQMPSLISKSRLVVVKKRKRAAGPVYTARLGAGGKSEAARMCLRISKAGGSCYVRRN
ncbi:lytic transglycosylase domain-containing protein [Paracoccaceae bacterium]|nr:lytic transglycosylase domain-containing protein [Paracoccaceae bacterium]